MISDNDLLLYYYRDGLDAAERARIGAALSEQPELAARLHRLVAQLDAAAAAPDAPVPEAVQRRWLAALDRAANGAVTDEQRGKKFTSPPWRMAAAVCAIGLFALIALVQKSPPPPQIANDPWGPTPESAAVASDPSAYERGLRVHLENTEWQLANLGSATGEERRRLIQTIISQNRLYTVAAERANEPQLARVLRAFTPILEQLAADGGSDASAEIEQLSFELKVMQARLEAANANRSAAPAITL